MHNWCMCMHGHAWFKMAAAAFNKWATWDNCSVTCVIPIYGHTTMCYTHIWSSGAFNKWATWDNCSATTNVTTVNLVVAPSGKSEKSVPTTAVLSYDHGVMPIYGHVTMGYTHIWSYDHLLGANHSGNECAVCFWIATHRGFCIIHDHMTIYGHTACSYDQIWVQYMIT